MSSKRKNNQNDGNSSNRNLDGRRLRTVNEAKTLAEYLAQKPEMEKKEREARRARWEQVVVLAERREEEIRNGSKGKVDGQWMEDKEEAGERAREAVLAVMRSGDYRDSLKRTSSSDNSDDVSENSAKNDMEKPKHKALESKIIPTTTLTRPYFGFDGDDDFLSDDQEEEAADDTTVGVTTSVNSKGKSNSMG